MYHAVYNRNISLMELIYKYDKQLNGICHEGFTLLTYCCKNDNYELIKWLVDKGCDLNEVDMYGKAPIHYLVSMRKVKAIEFLIEKGIEINTKIKKNGKTSLMLAIENVDIITCTLLLKHNADVNITDDDNRNALIYAIKKNSFEIMTLLLEYDINKKFCMIEATKYSNLDMIKVLYEHGCDINEFIDNNCPLFIAISNSSYEIIDYFLAKGVDLSFVDVEGQNCLHLCIYHRLESYCFENFVMKGADINCVTYPIKLAVIHQAINYRNDEILEILLRHKADIEITDSNGRTPLILASKYGFYEEVKLLLEHGADVHKTDVYNYNALWYSRTNRDTAIINLLRKYYE
ncbi:hypothetical protein TVAG_255560 [Trichomonas vaginalis G3]|uniref:Uncharacterized protein n=1 Tax=Trichomonas vaginalis (strain ATCC PRA-98 / G3) TaxID=412133 RepID=A2DYV3_TRIV3|nr:hypothetical protein TVAG_255560 [Trichomonas vaginalis G3]|eukprot:XP_001326587.1 hypothetical protein [Trichomonas vaginalis G3]